MMMYKKAKVMPCGNHQNAARPVEDKPNMEKNECNVQNAVGIF
jgi:hypothetical protein